MSDIETAAANASKRGWVSSEFFVTVAAIVGAAVLGALQVLASSPGKWQTVAAVALGMLAPAVAYARSRSNVKVAALEAAAVAEPLPPPGKVDQR